MKTIEKIEQSLNNANEIQFFPTPNYEKEPAVIVLIFKNPDDGVIGYNLLLDKYKDENFSLFIYQKDNKVDISIFIEEKGEVILIKDLNLNKAELQDFLNNEPKERRFVLAIGAISNGKLVLTATNEPFSPILVNGYNTR